MRDFLLFRRMLTPILLQIIFWLGVIACIVSGIAGLFRREWINGLEIILLGPIMVRIFCELLILFFRMNETLTEIKNGLNKKTSI